MFTNLICLALAFMQTALSEITQNDLRGIFIHHQEFCRETTSRIGTGGVYLQHRTSHSPSTCEQSTSHEWHINQDSVLNEEEFQLQLQNNRRRLTGTTEGHVYLARVAKDTLVTSDLRLQLEKDIGVTFDDYFKSVDTDNEREYFILYSADMKEISILEQEDSIDELIPLPPAWKLSPLLLGDTGHDDDKTPDSLKTLTIRISRRAKVLLGANSMTTLSKRMATELNQLYPALTLTVHSAGSEASTHFESIKESQMHTEASEWMVISNIPASLRDEIALIIAGFPETTRVEPVMLHTTSNAWARWITQSYKGATTDPSKNIGTTQRATVWNRGITGKNQVVGVGDSGLATKNCLFNDATTPMTVATGATFNSKTHRKVAQYVAFADGTFQKLKKMKNVVKMCCHYTRIVIIDYCGFLILLMVEHFCS